jgi:hypothetical protein
MVVDTRTKLALRERECVEVTEVGMDSVALQVIGMVRNGRSSQ